MESEVKTENEVINEENSDAVKEPKASGKSGGVKLKAKKAAKAMKDSAAKAKDATRALAKRTDDGVKAAREEAKRNRTVNSVQSELFVQFAGKSYAPDDLFKMAREVWQYDLKKDPADIRKIELYMKPAESRTYYVINGDVYGFFYI